MKNLVAFACCLLLAFPASGLGFAFKPGMRGAWGGLNVTASCPYGTSFPDGCASANTASTFKVSTTYGVAFNTYATATGNIGTGQTWSSAHPQPWNVAGVDYPVGFYTPQGSLLNPHTTPPAGCTYIATGGLSNGPRISCNTAGNLDIEGYDFGVENGISLVIGTSVNGSVIIKNNRFACGTAICNALSNGGIISISTNVPATSIYIGFNTFDGGDRASSTLCAGGPCTFDRVRFVIISNNAGSRTFEYNAFLYPTGRPISASSMGAYASIRRYNYFEGIQGADGSADHGEIYEESNPSTTVVPEEDDLYNTIVTAKTYPTALGTTLIYISSGSTTSSNNGGLPVTFTQWNVIGNTLIGNTSATALANNGGVTQNSITGTVSGSTLTVTGGPLSNLVGIAIDYPGINGAVKTRVISGTDPTYTLSQAPNNYTGNITTYANSMSGILQVSYSTVTNLVTKQNYMDGTGILTNICLKNVSGTIVSADVGAGGTPNSGGTQNVNILTGAASPATWANGGTC